MTIDEYGERMATDSGGPITITFQCTFCEQPHQTEDWPVHRRTWTSWACSRLCQSAAQKGGYSWENT